MRLGSNPRLAICHCTPPCVSSERSQRRVALGSGSFSSVRIRPRGSRNSSTPPPSTTSKRITARVPADSPSTFCSTISEPGLKARKSSRTSIRSAGCSGKSRARDRRLQQPAVGGDLQHLTPVAQLELVGARVGRVEEAQPVDPPLHGHPRRDRAVDQQRVAAEAEVDVLGVAERPVLVERVIGEHQRDVVLTLREPELGLALVLQQVGADEAVVERPRRAPVGVVVVPQERGVLLVRVRVVEPGAGRDHVHRVAVVRRRHVAAVEVHVGVERQLVALADDRWAVLAGIDRRPGIDALVAVDRRLVARQDLGDAFLDVDVVDIDALLRGHRLERRGDRQVALEGREHGARLRTPRGRCHHLRALDRRGGAEGADERDRVRAVAHEVAARPRVGRRSEGAHQRATRTLLRWTAALLPRASRASISTA